MTDVTCHHCLTRIERRSRQQLCTPCIDEERALLQRAESEDWLGSARAGIAHVLGLWPAPPNRSRVIA